MDRASFERALKFGFGSAVIHLQNNKGTTEYNDILYKYSIINSAYDWQCEGTKSQFLWDIIKHVGNLEKLQKRIMESLKDADSDMNDFQIFELGVLFYKDSKYNPIETMIENCRFNTDCYSFIGCDEIAEIADENIILIIANKIADKMEEDESYNGETFFLENLLKRFDADYLKDIFKELSNKNDRFRKYFYSEITNSLPMKVYSRKRLSYEEIKLTLPNIDFYTPMANWARKASKAELKKLDKDINTLDNFGLVSKLLPAYKSVPYNGSLERLIHLLGNPIISKNAVHALKWQPDNRTREKAIELIKNSSDWYDYSKLLINNYQEGDYNLLLSKCKNQYDVNEWHTIQSNLNSVFSKNANTYCHGLYTTLYKHNHCTICRNNMVEYMLRDGFDDMQILNELKWDANMQTREAMLRMI